MVRFADSYNGLLSEITRLNRPIVPCSKRSCSLPLRLRTCVVRGGRHIGLEFAIAHAARWRPRRVRRTTRMAKKMDKMKRTLPSSHWYVTSSNRFVHMIIEPTDKLRENHSECYRSADNLDPTRDSKLSLKSYTDRKFHRVLYCSHSSVVPYCSL